MANGQLEIVHGGMVSSDEACPNYADIVRNFELAHDFIFEEFGVRPKVGWQLDPFGHSAAVANLFAEMGLEAMVFARIKQDDFNKFKRNRNLEFVWSPEFSFAQNEKEAPKEIFSHVLFDHYNPPSFVSSYWYMDYAIVSDWQVINQVDEWIEYFDHQSSAYRTKNVIVMWGDDFSHMFDTSYNTLDKIISILNRNFEDNGLSNKYKLSYSTMKNYFESVFKDG